MRKLQINAGLKRRNGENKLPVVTYNKAGRYVGLPNRPYELMILLKINDCTIRMDKAIRMFVKGLKAFSSGISINSLAKGSIKSKLTL
jgi:hypothetical protein